MSIVGERALAAVRNRSAVDIYESQWAGTEQQLSWVLGAPVDEQFDALLGANWRYRGRYTTSLSRTVDYLDIEAVYLLSAHGVSVYLPVWLGFSPPDARASDGVLVPVETIGEYRRVRRTVQFLKELFHDAIVVGVLDSRRARDLLTLAVYTRCLPGQNLTSETWPNTRGRFKNRGGRR